MATEHFWVEMSYMPVTVEVNEEGDVTILCEEGAEEVMKEEALHGCWFCHTPLNTESVKTECQGQEAVKEV
jgi:hypothetical protein